MTTTTSDRCPLNVQPLLNYCSLDFHRSQEVFRHAMGSPSVCLEVLSVANKANYEKSLIGQLFNADGKDASAKTKSPVIIRVKNDPQVEPKPNTKLEIGRPGTHAKSLQPAAVKTPPAELRSGYHSLERLSPAPARAASTSPTPRTRSQSPLAAKSPVMAGLPNLNSRRGGTRIKIDLKKGNCSSAVISITSVIHFKNSTKTFNSLFVLIYFSDFCSLIGNLVQRNTFGNKFWPCQQTAQKDVV